MLYNPSFQRLSSPFLLPKKQQKSTMTQTITVGDYLITRLKQLGVDTIFGVPGDYNMGFLDQIEDFGGIQWGNNCNELNAAYAADGYARVNGLGAVVTTFGVGELSAVNAIAGSYSEMVPVVHIVGMPSTKAQAHGAVLHHTLGNGDFRVFQKMFAAVTITNASLTQENAANEIDRVLKACVLGIRPVYISLPIDVNFQKLTLSEKELAPLDLTPPSNPVETQEAALDAVIAAIAMAERPIILVDACAVRQRVLKETLELINRSGFPVYVSPMGKGAIDESHSQFRGVYAGNVTQDKVREEVESADLMLSIGGLNSDFNTGAFTYKLPKKKVIELHSYGVNVFYATYEHVGMREFIPKLTARLSPTPRKFNMGPRITSTPDSDTDKITHKYLWRRISQFLDKNSIIVAETGTSSFGCFNMAAPDGTLFINQILWGSIGYSVGAALGAAIAGEKKGRRVYLFVGDGSFQLTGQEVSTMLRLGLTPVILLLNNDGYTIEKLIHGPKRAYNSIQMWRYHQTFDYFRAEPQKCGVSRQVRTREELEKAMKQAAVEKDKIAMIEVMMEPLDAPEELVKQVRIGSLGGEISFLNKREE